MNLILLQMHEQWIIEKIPFQRQNNILYWLIHCTFFSLRWSDGNFEIIAMNAMNLRWKKKDFFQVENWLKIEILKKITKKGFFFLKSRFFLDQKLWKNPKNSKNQAKIDNAMNFSSSLRWIFIAKIFFTAMNSLLVSQCS